MLGIPGLDPFGLVHALFDLAALILGLGVVFRPKGTRLHRRIGYGYVTAMLLLNATALGIYELYDRFGPFHVASLISLGTIAAGFLPVFLRRPESDWMERHAYFMCWSYVGLVAAFLAEVAVRVPGVGVARAAFAGLVAAVAVGAVVIHRRVPRILARFTRIQGSITARPP